MKESREHVIDLVFCLSLLCVFTVCGLLVVFIGINVYKNTADNMEEAFSERTAMAFVAKQVRQNDRTDGVYVDEIDGQATLVLVDEQGDSTFCQYIYYYDGYLCALYAKDDYEPSLTAGQALLAIEGFDVVQNDNGTLTITVLDEDQNQSNLTLALQSS